MLFNNVIGQEAIKQQLLDLQANNRLSHAILFLGKEGAGALPLAINFAQHLVSAIKPVAAPIVADLFGGFSALRQEPAEEITSQNKPAFDPAAEQLLHPDLHFSYPVIPKKPGDKPISTEYIKDWREFYKMMPYGNVFDWLQFINAENKQGNITSEECNDIIRKLSLKAFQAPIKVLVMWMPEYLGKEGNKLLKLIEEPPPDTVFLLVAENEDQLLPTIISRCQVIRILPLDPADIEQALVEKSELPAEQARQIALVCEGNYREAMQLVQHNQEDWDALLKDWLNASLLRGTTDFQRFGLQNKIVEQLAGLGREKQKQLLRYFLELLGQSVRIRVMGADQLNLPENEKAFALKLNKISGISTQQAIVKELEQAIYYVERNANPKMLFHALTIKLRSIVLDKTVLLTT
ncbi:DNA polymerase III subunit delta' [soil metagenome]